MNQCLDVCYKLGTLGDGGGGSLGVVQAKVFNSNGIFLRGSKKEQQQQQKRNFIVIIKVSKLLFSIIQQVENQVCIHYQVTHKNRIPRGGGGEE